MLLLGTPFDAHRAADASAPARPLRSVAAAMLALLLLGAGLETWDGLALDLARALQTATIHGGFVALGLIIALGGRAGWRGPALRLATALFVAALATRWSAWGSVLYLLAPVLLIRESLWQPALRGIGLARPERRHAGLVGLAIGTFLGIHLLIATSLTFGYSVRISSLATYAAAVGYDVGANALSAEWLFRGALFSRWWRLWGFWAAAGTSTAVALARYLLDPALPRAIETTLGAVFYLALLGLSSCALRAWSGSLWPGYLATVAFFGAYRMLVPGW